MTRWKQNRKKDRKRERERKPYGFFVLSKSKKKMKKKKIESTRSITVNFCDQSNDQKESAFVYQVVTGGCANNAFVKLLNYKVDLLWVLTIVSLSLSLLCHLWASHKSLTGNFGNYFHGDGSALRFQLVGSESISVTRSNESQFRQIQQKLVGFPMADWVGFGADRVGLIELALGRVLFQATSWRPLMIGSWIGTDIGAGVTVLPSEPHIVVDCQFLRLV